MKGISRGITSPSGYRASAVESGIKPSGLDLALVVSDVQAVAAGMFTTNKIKAAPVIVSEQHLKSGFAQAVVLNSGCANACTGVIGLNHARRMTEVVAEELGLKREHVLVCSTGPIGTFLPIEKVEKGIKEAVRLLSIQGGEKAAKAIMTTDKVPKVVVKEVEIDNCIVTVAGMAKGSGMIQPNMATMLAVLTTDANVEADNLKECLKYAVDLTFNRITVDGCQSTNDSVIFLANKLAGNRMLNEKHKGWKKFCEAVKEVCDELSFKIVADGEGVTKVITIRVQHARNLKEAEAVARSIANSLLVKTSWYGADPNWGRVMDAIGYSGCEISIDKIRIFYDDVCVVDGGMAAKNYKPEVLREVLKKNAFSITVDMGLGKSEYYVRSCDCSVEYVKINSEYLT